MITVISHFFNEEYLLPWWLKHHRKVADHGVLIDCRSTDGSREAIRKLVPSWEVRPGPDEFDARQMDAIVQDVERGIGGWKIALNTTEFLVGPVRDIVANVGPEVQGIRTQALTMVDRRPTIEPPRWAPLLHSRPWALDAAGWERARIGLGAERHDELAGYDPKGRRRLLHRAESAVYKAGRHHWLSPESVRSRRIYVAWYGLSPWTHRGIARKAQIADRISDSDRRAGRGSHHLLSIETLSRIRADLAPYSDLSWRKSQVKSEIWQTLHSVLRSEQEEIV